MAQGWLDRAIGWRDSDDSFESNTERKKFIAYWKNKLRMGDEKSLMDYISDMWSIGFKEEEEQA